MAVCRFRDAGFSGRWALYSFFSPFGVVYLCYPTDPDSPYVGKQKEKSGKNLSLHEQVMYELEEEEKEKAKVELKEKYRRTVKDHILQDAEAEFSNNSKEKMREQKSSRRRNWNEWFSKTTQQTLTFSDGQSVEIETILSETVIETTKDTYEKMVKKVNIPEFLHLLKEKDSGLITITNNPQK